MPYNEKKKQSIYKYREGKHRRDVIYTDTVENIVSEFLERHGMSHNSFANKSALYYIDNHKE